MAQTAYRSDAIAQIALCRRARTDRDLVATEQRDVVVVDVNGVNRGQVWTQNSLTFEQLRGCAALDRQALLHFRRLLCQMDVQGGIALACPFGDGAHGRRIDRAHALDRRADANSGALVQVIHSLRPMFGVAVGEGLLDVIERAAVHAAPQVARIDEGDSNALLRRGGGQRLTEPAPQGKQLMKLADGGDPRLEHLANDESVAYAVDRPRLTPRVP